MPVKSLITPADTGLALMVFTKQHTCISFSKCKLYLTRNFSVIYITIIFFIVFNSNIFIKSLEKGIDPWVAVKQY
jgi:hypothetical protein